MIEESDRRAVQQALKGKTSGKYWRFQVVEGSYWRLTQSDHPTNGLVLIDEIPTEREGFRAIENVLRYAKTPLTHESMVDLMAALDVLISVMKKRRFASR